MRQRLRYAWADFNVTHVTFCTLAGWAVASLLGQWNVVLIWLIPLIATIVEFVFAYFMVWVDEEPAKKTK